jgi:hypothetical protein
MRSRRLKNRQYNGQEFEEQTIQWPRVWRTDNTMAKSLKNRQYNGQEFEDVKEVIRGHKLKDTQYNSYKKKDKHMFWRYFFNERWITDIVKVMLLI